MRKDTKVKKAKFPERDLFVLNLLDPSVLVSVREDTFKSLKRVAADGKVAVLRGELGAGKTTILQLVARGMKGEMRDQAPITPVLIPCSVVSGVCDPLGGILSSLAIDTAGKGKAELVSTLLSWPRRERLAVFLDDVCEASADAREVGEAVRAISDMPGTTVLLSGTPREIGDFIAKVPALEDRVQATIDVGPLKPEETASLLRKRAGLVGMKIPEKVCGEIHKLSRGNPRRALKLMSEAFCVARDRGVSFEKAVARLRVPRRKRTLKTKKEKRTLRAKRKR